LKKNQRQNIILAVIAVGIVSGIIGYNYYIDQIKVKGLNFGNEIQQIQDGVKKTQDGFESMIIQFEEGDLSKQEFLEYSQIHLSELGEIIPRYDALDPPDPFVPSVDLFRLSTESQHASDHEYIKWIETGEESYKIRSDSLFQESFDYELAALAKFQAAKLGLDP